MRNLLILSCVIFIFVEILKIAVIRWEASPIGRHARIVITGVRHRKNCEIILGNYVNVIILVEILTRSELFISFIIKCTYRGIVSDIVNSDVRAVIGNDESVAIAYVISNIGQRRAYCRKHTCIKLWRIGRVHYVRNSILGKLNLFNLGLGLTFALGFLILLTAAGREKQGR